MELVRHSGIDNLPEGLDKLYVSDWKDDHKPILSEAFLAKVQSRFAVPAEKMQQLVKAVQAIEADEKLASLTRFLIQDMCKARNRSECDDYHSMTPDCIGEHKEFYSLVLLLSCIEPAMKALERRGIPVEHYMDIPFKPMEAQMKKLIETGDPKVSDFPWDMNFYTGAIFLFDRFYFVPCRFGDRFTMYRHRKTGNALALRHGGERFRRDGQVDGINGVFDEKGAFETVWLEDETSITAHCVNPMGFVEHEKTTIQKKEWEPVLQQGDLLLGWHIPSGPGYTPARLKHSMELAMEFYSRYFPDLPIKGLWSESWLYDARLSLMLPEESNIVSMLLQFYNYPIHEGDGMLRYEVFGDWKADPDKVEHTSSLQRKAAAYMATGARFNTMSMVLLPQDIIRIGNRPYITQEDVRKFHLVVDSHLDPHPIKPTGNGESYAAG